MKTKKLTSALHREILFVPNIIHAHGGLLPCIAQRFQSCLIFILALFAQIFLKFSLEINSSFLVLKRVLRRGKLKIQYGGQGESDCEKVLATFVI